MVSTVEDLKRGFLKIDNSSSSGYKVNIPVHIKDRSKFDEVVFDAWSRIKIS